MKGGKKKTGKRKKEDTELSCPEEKAEYERRGRKFLGKGCLGTERVKNRRKVRQRKKKKKELSSLLGARSPSEKKRGILSKETKLAQIHPESREKGKRKKKQSRSSNPKKQWRKAKTERGESRALTEEGPWTPEKGPPEEKRGGGVPLQGKKAKKAT